MRPPHLPFILTALAVCQAVLPAQSSQARPSAELRSQYHQRTRAARRSPDARDWLRIEKWIQAQDVSPRTQKAWLRYTRTQYGIAAAKKLRDHDIDGWIALANQMRRLLQDESTARWYLETALKKSPDSSRLLQELGRYERGKSAGAAIVFQAQKEAAERSGSAAAFRKLAMWCLEQVPHNRSAQEWHDYCHARALYLSGRGGSVTDPIRIALEKAKQNAAAPTRSPRDARTPIGSFLPKRQSKAIRGAEARNGKRYRLESEREVSYSDSLPTSGGYDSVWERGTQTKTTWLGTQVLIESFPAWLRLGWDREAGEWVAHTRQDRRKAREKQIAFSRKRLEQMQQQLLAKRQSAGRYPDRARQSREIAERIAKNGGKVRDFTRALRNIVSSAGSEKHEELSLEEARRRVEAWKNKIEELQAAPLK